MKTNYERNYIRICRIVKNTFVLSILLLAGLISAELKIEEAPSVFTYKWEMSQEDLTEFVKSGQLKNSNISGSIYYEGRYYPVYTSLLENKSEQLTYRISDRETSLMSASVLNDQFGDLETKAIDRVSSGAMTDFVNLNEVPGVGTLLEIMPCLPQSDGSIRFLKKADIQLFSTSSQALKRSGLDKDMTSLAKNSSLQTDLPSEYCALYINEPGVYQVSGQDLADKEIDIRQIYPDNIKLHWWGEEIPCRVTSTYEVGQETFQYHDVVQFYIPEMKNPYGDYKFNPFSKNDVIVLSWDDGDGMRYVQENSEIDDSIDPENKFMPEDNRTFRSTIQVEKNQLYQQLARLHEEELSHNHEHSFYSPSIRIGRSVSFPFELWDPVLDSPYNVEFTIRMQGLTYSVDDEMDHQIYVTINDQYLLEDEWDGQIPKISSNMDMQFNHENLIHGENNINISVKGFEDNPYLDDQVLFDWLEVSYDRYMIAHNNRLKFTPSYGPGTYMFQIKGLTSASNVLILKNQTNWIRGYLVASDDNQEGEITYSVYFEDQCDGTEVYQVAGQGLAGTSGYGIEDIDSIRYVDVLENEYYSETPQGDYIIVTHKDFYEKALELVEHKTSLGMIPVIYELERIYDEYNHGNESPYAIKAFLTDAYYNWGITPEHVLLIGDVGTDNPLPVIRYQSSGAIGSIIADNWYTDLDDDFVLELALGRLPVSTEDQLDSIITKIKTYDLMEDPKPSNRMALLAGPEPTFKQQTYNYLNNVSPDYMQTDRLYLYDTHETGDFDAGIYSTDTLVNIINDGVFCLNYLGHGGGYTWDNHVLPYEDFERFQYGRPFVVNSLTCFTNTFSNENAIGEMLLRHPRGSVSVLSSTGYGWINSNYYLFEKLMDHMIYDKMSHGQALQHALTDYFFSSFGRNANFIDYVNGAIVYKYFRKTLFYQMCILGDPSVKFPQNKPGSVSATPLSVSEQQEIDIQVAEAGIVQGYMDVVGNRGQERKFPIEQKVNLDFTQGSTEFTLEDIPENFTTGMLQLTYWDNDNNTYVEAVPLAFNAPFINSVEFFPSTPDIGDTSIYIRLELDSFDDVDSVNLRVFADKDQSANYEILPMKSIGSGLFETVNSITYSGKTSFFSVQEDTGTPLNYYSGIYFMPELRMTDRIILGDYFRLSPNYELEQDISILDYSIESGKSKLILYNQADTSVLVEVSMSVDENDIEYSHKDTVLTVFDVDGYYDTEHEQANTFYFDFLPLYGNEEIRIEISPLEINDFDTSNNVLEINVNNKWLKAENGSLTNTPGDTTALPSDLFENIQSGSNMLYSGAVFINEYTRSYNLTEFGALQESAEVLYINTSDDEMSFTGSVSLTTLSGEKKVSYLSADIEKFYVLPMVTVDTMCYFPINEPGYYLIISPNESTGPDIELNINAREILMGGYVSERSDFSIILNDDHGVNPLTEFWGILLDDEELSEDDISVIESDDIKELDLNFKLEMQEGAHTLQVFAHDLVGNRSETEKFDIYYTGESELIDYGTFPNPFTNRTTFIYELTEQFDDVTIKIFTLSGQKIFTMSVSENAITDLPLYSIGYHEIPWDGKDEFGNTVANGVYFYIIEGLVDDQKIKSTGKIAKLR